MKADANTTITPRSPITSPGRRPLCSLMSRETLLSTPVRINPPERMNIAAIVHGAALEKIDRSASVGIIPLARSTAAVAKAVTSGGKTSRTKSTNIPAMTASVRYAAKCGCAISSAKSSLLFYPDRRSRRGPPAHAEPGRTRRWRNPPSASRSIAAAQPDTSGQKIGITRQQVTPVTMLSGRPIRVKSKNL